MGTAGSRADRARIGIGVSVEESGKSSRQKIPSCASFAGLKSISLSLIHMVFGNSIPARSGPVLELPRQLTPELKMLSKMKKNTVGVVLFVMLGLGLASAQGFKAFSLYWIEGYTTAITLADFNGDGNPDVIATNLAGNAIGIVLGNSDGTFNRWTQERAGNKPSPIAAGDFNGDGKLDLVVGNQTPSSGHITIAMGNGDGTFTIFGQYGTGGAPESVAACDLNGDGILDIAVARKNDGSPGGAISVLLGVGDGTFQEGAVYPTLHHPSTLLCQDFNGDANADLLIVNNTPFGSISTFLGNGDGTLQGEVESRGGNGMGAAGDFNGDGKLDVASTNGDGVEISIGNGDGTFQSPVTYTAFSGTGGLAIADLDGNGTLDLAVAATKGGPSILLGNGDGTFQPAIQLHLNNPLGCTTIAIGDLNGDSKPDIVAGLGGHGFAVFLHR